MLRLYPPHTISQGRSRNPRLKVLVQPIARQGLLMEAMRGEEGRGERVQIICIYTTLMTDTMIATLVIPFQEQGGYYVLAQLYIIYISTALFSDCHLSSKLHPVLSYHTLIFTWVPEKKNSKMFGLKELVFFCGWSNKFILS